MPFLKVVLSSQKVKYVYVVEAYREGGKIKHKYLFSLGKLEDLISSPGFKNLARLALKDEIMSIKDIDGEGEILKYGHIILKKLWNKFRLDKFFDNIQKERKRIKFDIKKVVFHMVARYILEPQSKHSIFLTQDRYIDIENKGNKENIGNKSNIGNIENKRNIGNNKNNNTDNKGNKGIEEPKESNRPDKPSNSTPSISNTPFAPTTPTTSNTPNTPSSISTANTTNTNKTININTHTHINLENFYRTLDILSDTKDDIEKYLFRQNLNLLNLDIDIVFYDVTTLYFESQNQDLIKRFGFSKDGKINRVQIVLGLLVDREGRPIGYDIFPGNTFEGKTLLTFLDRLKERFNVKKVIIVADRGINTKLNLGDIVEHGYSYIVSTRIKSLPRKLIDELLFRKEEEEEKEEKKEEEEEKEKKGEEKQEKQGEKEYIINPIDEYDDLSSSLYSSLYYKKIKRKVRLKSSKGREYDVEETLVSYFSHKMRERDRIQRERLIDKALALLEKPSSITSSVKRGGRRYIKGIGGNSSEYELDIEKIREDERFDGYYVIQTNTSLSPHDIREAYHNLWKIEESFRIMKSQLEIRPMYHWTQKRIKGHLVVLFLSFLLLRTLSVKLRNNYPDILVSHEKIRDALNSYTVTKIRIKGKDYYLKNKTKPLCKKINRILKIKSIPNLTPKEEFSVRSTNNNIIK